MIDKLLVMKRIVSVLFLVLIGSDMVSYAQQSVINWVQETPKATWQARDSQGEFVFKGQMWILGGWFTPQLPNPRDISGW